MTDRHVVLTLNEAQTLRFMLTEMAVVAGWNRQEVLAFVPAMAAIILETESACDAPIAADTTVAPTPTVTAAADAATAPAADAAATNPSVSVPV